MLLLQTLEPKANGVNSAELRLPQSTHSGRLAIDKMMAGLTGAIIGFVCAMVGGALGSAWGQDLPAAVAATVIFAFFGCLYARREYRYGDHDQAEFLLATVQAGITAGLGTSLGLACGSLVLLQLAFAAGVAGPALISRLPASAQAYSR